MLRLLVTGGAGFIGANFGTEDYFAGKQAAPRPSHSALAMDKIPAAGFDPVGARVRLEEYLSAGRST